MSGGILAFLSTQVVDITTVGRAVATAVSEAAARTAIGAQAADADLTALAGLTGTNNIYYRSAADTWSSVTIGTGLTFAGGTLAASGGAGISGSTGAVDNAVLRADGTGGATLQASAIIIPDNFTASPNNVVNHASLQATGNTTNVSVSIVPKGTGSFSLHVPDGTATGGNVRGANAVDLQTLRSAAAQVASGSASINIGAGCTASGPNAISIGSNCTASGPNAISIGSNCTSTSDRTIAIGEFCNATGALSSIFGRGTVSGMLSWGFGRRVNESRPGLWVYAQGQFSAENDCINLKAVMRCTTTGNTPTPVLLTDGYSFAAITRLAIPSGKILLANVLVVGAKSDGSAIATYSRKFAIKNVANTVTMVGTVDTLGTDHEDNASTDIAITADNTNKALQINVTGITAETWRWSAVVEGTEIAFGT